MKRTSLFLAMLLIAAGCSKPEQQEEKKTPESKYLESFQAVIDGDYTKAVADMNTGKVSWQDGDLVKVWNGTGAVDFEYDEASGTFLAQGELEKAETYKAFYPAWTCESFDEEKITATLPDNCRWEEDMVENAPMGAICKGSDKFVFKNLCAIICLNLTGEGTVTKVEFTSKGSPVAGTAEIIDNHLTVGGDGSRTMTVNSSVDLGPQSTAFHLIVPARKYEGGFSIRTTFSDGTFVVKETDKDISLAASQIDVEEAFEASWFSGGKGSVANPYKISSAEDLVLMSQLCNSRDEEYAPLKFKEACYQQTANIDFSGREAFQAIGDTNDNGGWFFSGSYDGGDFSISNIRITNANADKAVGLFGYISGGASVRNLTLDGISIDTGSYNVGAVVGCSQDGDNLIENVTVMNADIKAAGNCVGGIVGKLMSGTVNICMTGGAVSNQGGNIGGIAGLVSGTSAKVTNCASDMDVTETGSAKHQVGGIAGYASAEGCEISGCAFSGSVKGACGNVGGIVGYAYGNSNVKGNTVTGNVTVEGGSVADNGINIGGVIGYVDNKTGGDISANTSYATVLGHYHATGGIVGYSKGSIRQCDFYGTVSTDYEENQGSTYSELGGVVGWMISGAKVEKCTCCGTVDGTGKRYVGGVAGRQDGGSVIDCRADKAKVSGYQYVGGIVGYISAESNVSGCRTLGGSTVTGTYSEVGGIVGYANLGHISDCHFDDGTVSGATNHQIGGIAGTVTGSGAMINNCTTSGKVNATGGNAGGISGAASQATVRGCTLKEGAEVISGSSINVGGIVGFINANGAFVEYCNVERCLIKCAANNYAAGIVGRIYYGSVKGCTVREATIQSGMATGGIVGLITAKPDKAVSITECSTTGCHILSTNKLAGGIVGNLDTCEGNVTVADCTVSGGDVTTDTAGISGGIVSGIGNNNTGLAVINRCTASCDLTNNAGTASSGNVGGILGWTNNTVGTVVVANCIYHGGSLINKGSGASVGGIVGGAGYSESSGQRDNSIVNCVSFPKLLSNTTNNGNVAGIVGYTTYNRITNCWSPVENSAVLVNNATSNTSRGSIYGWQKFGAVNTDCYYRSDFKAGAKSGSYTYTETLQSLSDSQMKNNGSVTIPSSGEICDDFVSALNKGAADYNSGSPVGGVRAENWVMGTNGYPVIEGCPIAGESPSAAKTRVGLIGDSISTFKGGASSYPYNGQYPSQDVTSVEQTYWYKLIYEKMSGAVLDVNTSYTGTTVQNTLNKGHMGLSFLNRYTDLVNPDVIFINGGTNDGYSFNLPLGTLDFNLETDRLDTYQFAQAYDKLVRLLKARFPSAKIFPIIAPCMTSNTKSGDYSAYGKVVKDICAHYGLHYAEIVWDYNTYAPSDGVHPNAAGHAKMADVIYSQLKEYL